MTSKRKIVFVTTARSDYSTMFPVMQAAQSDSEIESVIFCGGMHLLKEFGDTHEQLLADGLEISEKIDFMRIEDKPLSLPESLGRGTVLFAEALLKHQPDFVVVSGDRVENLALFNATTSLKVPVAHLCGGDITEGAFDNQIRHTMTKLSHLHFVSMEEHARRVLQMGEEPWRITVTGDAAIDTIVKFKIPSKDVLYREIGIPDGSQLVLSTFHPQTLGSEDFVEQYRNVLKILEGLQEIPVLSYPNIDPGFKPLIVLLEDFRKIRPDVIIRKSFTREQYYGLLAHSNFMIGNSSSGLWEAPSFSLPNVNVGNRQAGRLRGKNVIDVSGLDFAELRAAVSKAKSPEFKKSLIGMKNPYGNGGAAELTLQVLKRAPLGDVLMVKKFFEIALDVRKFLIQ